MISIIHTLFKIVSLVDCGEVTASTGVITSTNWPDVYPDDTDCQIVINPDEEGVLVLTLIDFQFETQSDGDCWDTWKV